MARPLLNSKFFIHHASSSLAITFNVTVAMCSSLVLLFVVAEDTESEYVLGE